MCPGPDSNRHAPCGARDFKSRASTSFATRAWAASSLTRYGRARGRRVGFGRALADDFEDAAFGLGAIVMDMAGEVGDHAAGGQRTSITYQSLELGSPATSAVSAPTGS